MLPENPEQKYRPLPEFCGFVLSNHHKLTLMTPATFWLTEEFK